MNPIFRVFNYKSNILFYGNKIYLWNTVIPLIAKKLYNNDVLEIDVLQDSVSMIQDSNAKLIIFYKAECMTQMGQDYIRKAMYHQTNQRYWFVSSSKELDVGIQVRCIPINVDKLSRPDLDLKIHGELVRTVDENVDEIKQLQARIDELQSKNKLIKIKIKIQENKIVSQFLDP